MSNTTEIILIILFSIVILIFIYIRIKIALFSKKYFGTYSLKKGYEKYAVKTDTEAKPTSTARSISSLEPVYLPEIKKDFPTLNIDELKAQAEKNIIKMLQAIETKDLSKVEGYKGLVKEYIYSRIQDNKNVKYNDIKIHRTAINDYKKTKATATIIFITTYEYTNHGLVEGRIKSEYIFTYKQSRKEELGLNCPNCGAVIEDKTHQKCTYCGATALNVEYTPWELNNIKEE